MNLLIVEDENLAFERLTRLLKASSLNIQNIQQATSIREAVNIIQENTFDLAFFDIELSDGLSFEILEQVSIDFPIIFTTAYNQYAIQAFKHNSVDYLLKPIDKQELQKAIDKYKAVWTKQKPEIDQQQLLSDFKNLLNDNYKKRFTVKIGEHIRIIETSEIKLIYSENKGTYIHTTKGNLIDYSLGEMEHLLSPKQFFRISRQYIVAISAIKDIVAYSNSRLKVILNTNYSGDLIVSREKVKAFKMWLESE